MQDDRARVQSTSTNRRDIERLYCTGTPLGNRVDQTHCLISREMRDLK